MDRIIQIKVGGNYLSKDNKNAGVTGEGNVTHLRISFDEGWDGYAKTVTFWDALGGNPTDILLTVNRLEDATKSTRVYLVPIPAEAMTEAGELTFVIDGYIGHFEKDGDGKDVLVLDDGKRQRSIAGTLEVKYSPMTDNAAEPKEPTPTPDEQIQVQIEAIIEDIQKAFVARDEAKEHADTAEIAKDSAEEWAGKAELAAGKVSYIGANGNWFAWDSNISAFYDTGVKAQAGSTVYVGDNPPAEADVWINPEGELLVYVTAEELRAVRETLEAAMLVLSNKVAPTPASITLYADRWEQVVGKEMWYQEVEIDGVTPRSKVDLQLNAEQIAAFYEKDLALVTENNNGRITVYSIGRKPENTWVIQATVSEVVVDG